MMNPAEELTAQPAEASVPPPPPAPSQQPIQQPVAAYAPAVNDPRRKKPLLASILSAVMPGVGQVYVGYYRRGFVNAITVAVLITLTTLDIDALIPLVAIFLGFFWLYNIVDAGRSASLYNQALAGGSQIELPEEFEAPGLKGSILGGALLILAGLVLLSNTLFGFSLAWFEQWWPVAVIAFGGYLVFKAIQEKTAEGGARPNEE